MKISVYQLFWLIAISSIIETSYIPIRLATEQAMQDSWISILIAGTAMLILTWIMLKVCMQNEEQTLVGFLKKLLGTWIGKFVVVVYFYHWFMRMGLLVRAMAEFQNVVLLHNTPTIAILLCFLLLVIHAIWKGGIVTVSRCAEVIGPLFFASLYIQIFLNPKDFELGRLLPMFADSGWYGILTGAFYSFNQLMDPTIVLMLFFFADDKKKAARAVLGGTALTVLWGVLTSIVLVCVNGAKFASVLVAPVYSLSKMVSILNFVQNIDVIYIPFWLLGAFVKVSASLFILSYGLSEWLGFKNWKLIAGVITACLLAFTVYASYNLRLAYSVKDTFQIAIFNPFVFAFVPLLLWAIGSLKKRSKRIVTE